MATGGGVPLPVSSSSLQQNVVSQGPPQHGGPSAPPHSGAGDANVLPEEGKIRELALQIHCCLFQAQQLKLASMQQQSSAATNQQVRNCLVAHINDFCTPCTTTS